jgi:16S rRNA (guanine966-N2)-methyltransferase
MALEPLLDLRVVDLFAGSGALGIEALSRGAAHADFVEPDRGALAALRRNLADLGLEDRSRVWPLRLPQGLRRIEASLAAADLVLLDPPYGGDPARRTLEALGRPGALKAGCRVVLEHHAKDAVSERAGALERTAFRRYGETLVSRFEPRAAEGPPLEEPGT